VQIFETLASELHATWTRAARDEAAFPELAHAALERFAPSSTLGATDVLRWAIETDRLPRQFDPASVFSNLALTVASRDGFHIDVLVWTDSTTSIHQHSFSGAFHVLQGSSLHASWAFRETKRWGDRLKRGDIVPTRAEWLKTGSTRVILPGERLIHSLFHLDNPSLTVVVRTPTAVTVSPQFTYERSGLAYDPHFALERTEKLRQTLGVLWSTAHPDREELTEVALRGVDLHSATGIVSSLRKGLPVDVQSRVLDLFAPREPELAALMRATIGLRERERHLVELRKRTVSPRHRLLLALLLNLPDRASIESALGDLVPETAPRDWIWASLRDMHDSLGVGGAGTNVLGLRLTDVSERALRVLLDGGTQDEASRAIAEHPDLLDDARQLCAALAASPVLSPLVQHL
jgi:hypothetical protein